MKKFSVPNPIEAARKGIKKVVEKVKEAAQLDFFASFRASDSEPVIDFPIDMGRDTVWATQKQMAALFGVDEKTVQQYIENVFARKELPETDHRAQISLPPANNNTKHEEVSHYSLDVIFTVGYRIDGGRAAEFRTWANNVLRGLVQDGYALDGRRLNSDPSALRNLAAEVRAIRTSEKNIYEQVREAFKACSIDYDGNSQEARSFFAQSQDRFHYAISERTAAQIILERANHKMPNMGMTAIGNQKPNAALAKVAKNYMTADELRTMELLGEQWLLFAESMAQRQKPVSMQRLITKLDELIAVMEYKTFPGYQGRGNREAADAHAKKELELYQQAQRLPPPA
jgi:hypothetical protein